MTSYSRPYLVFHTLDPHPLGMGSFDQCINKDLAVLRQQGASIRPIDDSPFDQPDGIRDHRSMLKTTFYALATWNIGLDILVADTGWWLVSNGHFVKSGSRETFKIRSYGQ